MGGSDGKQVATVGGSVSWLKVQEPRLRNGWIVEGLSFGGENAGDRWIKIQSGLGTFLHLEKMTIICKVQFFISNM